MAITRLGLGGFPRPALAVDTAITAKTATISIVGQKAGVNAKTFITAKTATIAVVGQKATVVVGTSVLGKTATISVVGQKASVNAKTFITAKTATLSVAGQKAGINAETNLTAKTAAIAVTGQKATIVIGTSVNAKTATIAFTGQKAGINAETNVTAKTAQISITGQKAGVNAETGITAKTAAIAFTGQKATVLLDTDTAITAKTAGLVFTGQKATVVGTAATTTGTSGGNYGRVWVDTPTKKKKKKPEVVEDKEQEPLKDFSEFLDDVRKIGKTPLEEVTKLQEKLKTYSGTPSAGDSALLAAMQMLISAQMQNSENIETLRSEILSEIAIEKGLIERMDARLESAQAASERSLLIKELERLESEDTAQIESEQAKREKLRALLLALASV